MNDPGSSLHRLTLFAAVILLALALAGCAKKITSVDPSYISPEGQPETSALQVVQSPDRHEPVPEAGERLRSVPG
jgi:hypothetical protein